MLWVSALVTTLVLAVGALSVYTMHTYVDAISDTEVAHSLAAFQHSYVERGGGPADLTGFTGQAPGTLIAILDGGEVLSSAMFDDDGPTRAPAGVVADLEGVDWTAGRPQTVALGDEGGFRVAGADTRDGLRLVSAVSLESANEAIAKKIVAVAVITAVAALLAAGGTVVLVRQALRPMRRVAATAARAARMPLADDEHRIFTRVRRADTDPDNEVGIVGETLNRLLANVDTALAVRAESDRRMRRFLTDASHELRTPLAAIQGYAELTRQDGAELPDTTEYALARIESESRRMTALVGDMLLLSRMDEGQGLEIEPLDLCALVVDAINDVAVTAPDHHFLADLPDDPVWVGGDRARLHQVVSNLLTNARNHTPAGVTVTTTVRPSSEDPEQWVALSVVDDGPGVDPELLPDLFGRFVRASTSRSRDANSSGLGLAIVSSIVEAHGGTVGARSRPGRTEFLVRLPGESAARRDASDRGARVARVTPAP